MYCLKKRVWIGSDASGMWLYPGPSSGQSRWGATVVTKAGGTFLFRGWWSLWPALVVRLQTSVMIQSAKWAEDRSVYSNWKSFWSVEYSFVSSNSGWTAKVTFLGLISCWECCRRLVSWGYRYCGILVFCPAVAYWTVYVTWSVFFHRLKLFRLLKLNHSHSLRLHLNFYFQTLWSQKKVLKCGKAGHRPRMQSWKKKPKID